MTPPLPSAVPVAYLRRSRVMSNRPGTVSHASQLEAVKKLADDPRLVVLEDWGVSGQGRSVHKRPGYAQLRRMIETGECSALFSYSMSRLARSVGELSDLIELCNEHGVMVRTVDREVDTGTATGRLIVHVLSAVDQFIAEIAAEHGAATLETMRTMHSEAGLTLPEGQPVYGTLHVKGPDGLMHVVPDPAHPIEPVLAAYRQTHSVRQAGILLQAQGLPAPRGGKVWGSSTLGAILKHYVPEELPEPNPRGLARPVTHSALLAGLMRCFCGRTMTPNVGHAQYFCAGGRDSGRDVHGQYTVSERKLLAVLKPEAERYGRHAHLTYGNGQEEKRAALEKTKERTLTAFLAGGMSEIRYRAELAGLNLRLDELARQDRNLSGIRFEKVPEWSDVAAMNSHLRRLWTVVTLDHEMRPTVQWGIPDYMYDEDAAIAFDAKVAAEPHSPEEAAWMAAHNGLPF